MFQLHVGVIVIGVIGSIKLNETGIGLLEDIALLCWLKVIEAPVVPVDRDLEARVDAVRDWCRMRVA
jgi:hypothetical protein